MNTPNIHRAPQRYIKKPKPWFSSSGLLLTILPFACIPATIAAFSKGNLPGIIINAGGYALFLFAANLMRRGLNAEQAYETKRVTPAPKWPLKTLAALLVAFATFVIAWLGAHNALLVAITFGSGAFLGMYLNYGFDPRTEKNILGGHGYTTEEITQTIGEAEKVILSIEAANNQIRNAEFNKRIERICDTAKNILVELEANPAAIRRTRKFLLVYLEGASKVTAGYASTHKQIILNNDLEQNFRNVLDSIETVFKEQKEKLLEEDLFDLDVQMEVLATQLKNEGVV
ncbi:MAG: 5-bromo-4-chloroindolyl phosphate hydrolysis family protein [Methylococcales bacterium]